MSLPRHTITLPDYWSPDQALAVLELIDLIRDQLGAAYGAAMHKALRDDLQQTDPRQLLINLDDDVPF